MFETTLTQRAKLVTSMPKSKFEHIIVINDWFSLDVLDAKVEDTNQEARRQQQTYLTTHICRLCRSKIIQP